MKSLKFRTPLLALSALVLLAAAGCDKASPVAPQGSFLTISASPTKVGLTGASTITVEGRKPTGGALNDGTEVRFVADKGTVTPAVAEFRDGRATATFRADGRPGIAKVSAITGTSGGGGTATTAAPSSGSTSVTIDIQVGETPETKPTVLVSANPNTITTGATSTITVIGRNADGSPVPAGQKVTLTTTLGTLDNPQPSTDDQGTARAVLTAGTQAGTATVTAFIGASDAKSTDVTIRDVAARVLLSANPTSVSKSAAESTVTITALVSNAQGEGVPNVAVTFTADTGEFSPGSLKLTNTSGIATVDLTLTQQNVEGEDSVRVTASAPGAGGEPVSGSVVIDVE